jgi:hypothetical protein
MFCVLGYGFCLFSRFFFILDIGTVLIVLYVLFLTLLSETIKSSTIKKWITFPTEQIVQGTIPCGVLTSSELKYLTIISICGMSMQYESFKWKAFRIEIVSLFCCYRICYKIETDIKLFIYELVVGSLTVCV